MRPGRDGTGRAGPGGAFRASRGRGWAGGAAGRGEARPSSSPAGAPSAPPRRKRPSCRRAQRGAASAAPCAAGPGRASPPRGSRGAAGGAGPARCPAVHPAAPRAGSSRRPRPQRPGPGSRHSGVAALPVLAGPVPPEGVVVAAPGRPGWGGRALPSELKLAGVRGGPCL